MSESEPLPLRTRALVGLTSLAVGCVGAEALTRFADGGALPHLALFEQNESGTIALQALAEQTVAGPNGPFSVETDASGCRVGSIPHEQGWLIVGDSQVLGMGVLGDETFSARGGHRNCGVPGHGVADAAVRAHALVGEKTQGVVVVVNQANDWEEGLVPVEERYTVSGGRLLRSAAQGQVGKAFWASPLPRSHLLYSVAMLGLALAHEPGPPPDWMASPEQQATHTASLADTLDALARRLEPLPVVAVYLPVDVAADETRVPSSPFGRYTGGPVQPWAETHLRDQLQDALSVARFVDLLPVLHGHPGAFLEQDYHLSAEGHSRVAAALASHLGEQ
jgi:hypothetical protein